MQISMSGASGFIGNILKKRFIDKGWLVNVITRESLLMEDNEFIAKKIEGSDVVINLAEPPLGKMD